MHRYKQLPISPMTLLEMFKGGTFEVIKSGLPKDVKLINLYNAPERHCFMFVIESQEFNEVAEGEIIPGFSGDILIKKLS